MCSLQDGEGWAGGWAGGWARGWGQGWRAVRGGGGQRKLAGVGIVHWDSAEFTSDFLSKEGAKVSSEGGE